MNTMLSQQELKEYLDYDPNTGHLTWIKKANKKTVLGSRAGSKMKSVLSLLFVFRLGTLVLYFLTHCF